MLKDRFKDLEEKIVSLIDLYKASSDRTLFLENELRMRETKIEELRNQVDLLTSDLETTEFSVENAIELLENGSHSLHQDSSDQTNSNLSSFDYQKNENEE